MNSFEDALKMIGKTYADLPEMGCNRSDKKFLQWYKVFSATEHGNNSENRTLINNEYILWKDIKS